jgi:hypothetical protein
MQLYNIQNFTVHLAKLTAQPLRNNGRSIENHYDAIKTTEITLMTNRHTVGILWVLFTK